MIREHNKDYSICQDAIYIVPGHTTYVGEFQVISINIHKREKNLADANV